MLLLLFRAWPSLGLCQGAWTNLRAEGCRLRLFCWCNSSTFSAHTPFKLLFMFTCFSILFLDISIYFGPVLAFLRLLRASSSPLLALRLTKKKEKKKKSADSADDAIQVWKWGNKRVRGTKRKKILCVNRCRGEQGDSIYRVRLFLLLKWRMLLDIIGPCDEEKSQFVPSAWVWCKEKRVERNCMLLYLHFPLYFILSTWYFLPSNLPLVQSVHRMNVAHIVHWTLYFLHTRVGWRVHTGKCQNRERDNCTGTIIPWLECTLQFPTSVTIRHLTCSSCNCLNTTRTKF